MIMIDVVIFGYERWCDGRWIVYPFFLSIYILLCGSEFWLEFFVYTLG
jgi:hypothetical protein